MQEAQIKNREKEKKTAVLHRFYSAFSNYDKNGAFKGIDFIIDRLEILNILKEEVFFRHDINKETGLSVYVLIKKNIVKEVSITYIRDSWFKYLESLPIYEYPSSRTNDEGNYLTIKITPEMLINKFLGSIGNYLSEQIIDRLTPNEDLVFVKDKKNCKYFYYKNGFLTVTANNIGA
ncbi:MAG: hypothetical protein K0B10_07250 [Vicingaceae bacterium]|nr:hypothetical protein [Vicingaceae bacterium]